MPANRAGEEELALRIGKMMHPHLIDADAKLFMELQLGEESTLGSLILRFVLAEKQKTREAAAMVAETMRVSSTDNFALLGMEQTKEQIAAAIRGGRLE